MSRFVQNSNCLALLLSLGWYHLLGSKLWGCSIKGVSFKQNNEFDFFRLFWTTTNNQYICKVAVYDCIYIYVKTRITKGSLFTIYIEYVHQFEFLICYHLYNEGSISIATSSSSSACELYIYCLIVDTKTKIHYKKSKNQIKR